MSDERLAELRRLAGDEYVVFRRTDWEQRKAELEKIAFGDKGTQVIQEKRVPNE